MTLLNQHLSHASLYCCICHHVTVCVCGVYVCVCVGVWVGAYSGSALSSRGQSRLGPITMAMLLQVILVTSE